MKLAVVEVSVVAAAAAEELDVVLVIVVFRRLSSWNVAILKNTVVE